MLTSKEMTESEYSQLLNARQKIYQLLYILFSKPLTLEIYNELKQGFQTEEFSNLFEEDNNFYEFYNSTNVIDSIELAREDYHRLFVGPGSLLAPPWESVYRGKEKSLFDFTTFEVAELYNQFNLGIEKKENHHVEAADHLLFELEFMMVLIDRTLNEENPDTLSFLLKGQKTMLNDHLSKWIPEFCKNIHENAKSKLFIGLSSLLVSFIEFDCELVEELIKNN